MRRTNLTKLWEILYITSRQIYKGGLKYHESLFVCLFRFTASTINLEIKEHKVSFSAFFCAIWNGTTHTENNTLVCRKVEIISNTQQILVAIYKHKERYSKSNKTYEYLVAKQLYLRSVAYGQEQLHVSTFFIWAIIRLNVCLVRGNYTIYYINI